MKALRYIGGIIAGMIAAFALVASAEAVVHVLYPPPPGTNMDDFEQVKKFVAALPLTALVLVLAGWLIGTFVATWLAAKIARDPISAYIVGALLLAGGVFNAIKIPQPVWFSIVSFVIYIGATWVGARAGKTLRTAVS
jgi:pimeloyl-ACP methyl ester carboxylesterase